jgi:uncharacterized protein YkwD
MSANRIHKKLDKLFNSDVTKCLTLSKKYIDKKPKQAAPYFFASAIYCDKVEKSNNARGRYLNMRRALNYATNFNERADDELKELVNWDVKSLEMRSRTALLVYELDRNQMEELSQHLIISAQQLGSFQFYQVTKEEPKTDSYFTKPLAKEMNPASAKVESHYYGLPLGNELVLSSSPQKEQEMLQLINKLRASKNLPALSWNENLTKAARYHAYDLGTQMYFDHNSCDRIDGKIIQVGTTFERIEKFYKNGRPNGENIAAGHESPNESFLQWKNSALHYENMIKLNSRYVGIGVVYVPNSPFDYYWVMTTAE